jgi:hypothetical protein
MLDVNEIVIPRHINQNFNEGTKREIEWKTLTACTPTNCASYKS